MEPKNKVAVVDHVVCGGRLQIGGRWYFNGQHVKLDPKDAEIYASRGLTRPVRIAAVEQKVEREPEAPRETLTPQQVGVQTKVEDNKPIATPTGGVETKLDDKPVDLQTLNEAGTEAKNAVESPTKEQSNGKPRKPNR